LFVARIAANHIQAPVPLYQLAILANALDASANFHGPPPADLGAQMAETTIVTREGAQARGKIRERE
jgi:hypothetical protein